MSEAEQHAAPLFDAAFYRASRPDLAGSDADLLRHYVTFGWREGSSPHALFDPRYAAWQAGGAWPPDVEPFGHWQQGGWQAGVAPHPLFDLARIRAVVPDGDPLAGYAACGISAHALFDRAHYAAQRPDMPPGMDPFAHYLLRGVAAGLSPHPLFDGAYYARLRPDVVAAGLLPLTHYVQFGADTDCQPHPLISPAHYRAQVGAVEPIAHMMEAGGRASPHPLFDVGIYAAAAGPFDGLPLLHYLAQPAPCSTHRLFDEEWYRATHRVTGPALLHYLTEGAAAGLAPHPLFDSAGYGPIVHVMHHTMPPLMHYVTRGERQGRRPNALFSQPFYRAMTGVEGDAFLHYLDTGEALGCAASPAFRARRYTSRYRGALAGGGSVAGAMAHALATGNTIPAAPITPSIAADDAGPVGATIVLIGPPDAEAQRMRQTTLAGIPTVSVPDVMALRAWAATAAGPVVLIAGAAVLSRADLRRLVHSAPSHPLVLDRAGDVRSAGVTILGGLAYPRGAGADPLAPALNTVCLSLTAGPVLALPSPDAIRTIDPALSLATAFLTLGADATCQPGAQAVDLAATVGGPDPAPIPAPVSWTAPTATPRRRALFIESIVPRAGFDAGSYYALQLMAMYQGFGYDVTLLPDAELAADPAIVRPVADAGIVVQQAPFTPTTAAFINRELTNQDGPSFDVVVMARHTSGGKYLEALRARWPDARLVFHPGDLHYLREQRAAALLAHPDARAAALTAARATQRRELALVAAADVTVVVSSVERVLLGAAGVGARVVQIDPEYANRAPAPYIPAERAGVAFIGGYGHTPNVDAVTFLVSEIWPIVTASRADITLHIIGSAPPAAFDAFAAANVVVHGRIDDLDGMLDTLRLTVAPLRYGAGVKMKVITSLAAGVPVVATPIAVEGTGLEGKGAVLAGDAAAIAAAVLALYDDLPALDRLSAAGRAAVADRFSAAAVRRAYRAAVGV